MAQSIAKPPPPPTICKQCGAPLSRQAVVCRACGCVPMIEESSIAVKSALVLTLHHARNALRSIITNRFAVLWILALIPFVMVTPFAVLAYCAFMILRPNSALTAKEMLHLAAISGVALVNLKLSYDFGQDAIYWLLQAFRGLRNWIMHTAPPGSNPTIRSA